MKPKILAIETSTDACSVALLNNGQVDEDFRIAPRQHGQLALPMINALLTKAELTLAQLDALAFAYGPGAFTGIRIAAGVMQGLAFSAPLPVITVSTLQTLAQGFYRKKGAKQILPALDARMREIYWGQYCLDDKNIMQPLQPDVLCLPTQIPIPSDNHWYGAGDAWQVYSEILRNQCQNKLDGVDPEFKPHAQDVAILAQEQFLLGRLHQAEKALPIYLRGAGAWKKISEQ